MNQSKPKDSTVFHETKQTISDSLTQSATRIRTVDDFKQWTREKIRPILPHGSLISGWGHLNAGGVGLDYMVTVDFPMDHIDAVRNRVGAIDTPILRRWLSTQQPVIFDAANPWPDTPESWLASFRRHDLRNALAHGVVEADRCSGTYHSFFQIPGTPDHSHIDALNEVLPALNEALCRVIALLSAGDRFAKCLSFLNERERDITRWVRLGKTNGEIAQITGMSESTIKHYMTQIFDKVGASNRAHLVRCLTEHEARKAPGHNTKLF